MKNLYIALGVVAIILSIWIVMALQATPASNSDEHVVYTNTLHGYRLSYPATFEMDADVYGGSSDLTQEPHIYLRNPKTYDRFEVEYIDPTLHPSVVKSLQEYATQLQERNSGVAVSALQSITIAGKPAYSFTTDGSFEDEGGGWTSDVVRNKRQTYIFIENDGRKYQIWYPTEMPEAEEILQSFSFIFNPY